MSMFVAKSRRSFSGLRRKIGIPRERFFLDMLETGNTVSATIPIGLEKLLAAGEIRPGARLMLAGFGVGYSWGGVVVEM